MRPLLILFSVVGLLFSCNKEKKQRTAATTIVHPIATKSTATDTLEINSKTIVVFQKDSIAVEKLLKEATDEEAFYTASDDYGYYIANATEFIEKQKIKIVASNKKYLKFIGADATPLVIKVDTLQGFGGMYFFTPAKKPHLVDITIPEEEYKDYFGK
jgi:hypothetical protein